MAEGQRRRGRPRWRDYTTDKGRRPVKEFLGALSDEDAAVIAAAMKDVRENGLPAARHLRDDIYEVRADADRVTYRVLFAPEGRSAQVFLALAAFKKKTRKTPPHVIDLAARRLSEWRQRAATPAKSRRPSRGRSS